jgi:sugar lactone lactonase
MRIEFLDETKCELGEGPTFDPLQNKAWWFDIIAKKLFEHDFSLGETSQSTLPFMASMLAVIDDKTQLIAAENGLYFRDTQSGELTLHVPLEANNKITRSNDGRVHESGALWIGTMGKNAEADAGAIYHYHKGKVSKLFDSITIPNAICFSPDAKTAYFTDTTKGQLMKVAIDPSNAIPIGKPETLYDHHSKNGGLDGAVIDVEGNLWCALWGASSLIQISPEGEIIQEISVPVTQPTCPCFVGQNLDQLLVTSAWQGKPKPADTKGNSGKTLLITLPVSGKAEPRVIIE